MYCLPVIVPELIIHFLQKVTQPVFFFLVFCFFIERSIESNINYLKTNVKYLVQTVLMFCILEVEVSGALNLDKKTSNFTKVRV